MANNTPTSRALSDIRARLDSYYTDSSARADISLLLKCVELQQRALESLIEHDRVRGYPTGVEWIKLIANARKLLEETAGES